MSNFVEHEDDTIGEYFCKCHICGIEFINRKQRVHCKSCHDKCQTAYNNLTDDQKKSIYEVLNRDTIDV